MVRDINSKIADMDSNSSNAIGSICREVLSNTAPPAKIKEGMGTCRITGLKAISCVDIGKSSKRHLVAAVSRRQAERQTKEKRNKRQVDQTRDGKCFEEHRRFRENLELNTAGLNTVISHGGSCETTIDDKPDNRGEFDTIVHPKFSHFFVMLWYVGKIDHVIRNYTRCWLENNRYDNELQTKSIQCICNDFSIQYELIEHMFTLFCHGYKHIITSINDYSAT
jgi:hypothetical protein